MRSTLTVILAVVGLSDAEVDETGDLVEFGEYFVGDLAIVEVSTSNWTSMGEEAEVVDLGDDIGGQEVEGDAGEVFWESFAWSLATKSAGAVVFLRETMMSPSPAPKRPDVVLQVDGCRRPDVVEDVVHLGGVDDLRMSCSTRDRRVGRSLRCGVLLGADVWRMKEPLSLLGKKF